MFAGGFGGGGTSAFGAKPAFGAFGGTGTSTFGSGGTGAFGQTNTTGTNAFGQPTNTGGAFGGGGLFGAKPATTGVFGSTPSTGGTAGNDNATGGVAPVTTGTANPPYSVHTEKDTTGATAVTLHYQSISMMPAYRGSSFEVNKAL